MIKPKLFLQAGLAFVFFYAGISILQDPQSWLGFVPTWLEFGPITREMFLYANAIFEITLAFAILSGKRQKLFGWLAFAHLLTIVGVSGISLLPITFRDIGLAFAALAYAYLK
jgi:hypothetical protein